MIDLCVLATESCVVRIYLCASDIIMRSTYRFVCTGDRFMRITYEVVCTSDRIIIMRITH